VRVNVDTLFDELATDVGLTGDTGYTEWAYNLNLVKPGVGTAKKSASRGSIYYSTNTYELVGFATDDLLSVKATLPLGDPDPVTPVVLIDNGELQSDVSQLGTPGIEFWVQVKESIDGDATNLDHRLTYHVSPDRLRKFSLFEPRGLYPLQFKIVNWSGREVLRFWYGPNLQGSLALLDVER
jgi:hypothetical protein